MALGGAEAGYERRPHVSADYRWPLRARRGQSGVGQHAAGHEWAMIEEALRASGGRIYGPAGAAARLVARSTFESIRRLGINKTRFRAPGRDAMIVFVTRVWVACARR